MAVHMHGSTVSVLWCQGLQTAVACIWPPAVKTAPAVNVSVSARIGKAGHIPRLLGAMVNFTCKLQRIFFFCIRPFKRPVSSVVPDLE